MVGSLNKTIETIERIERHLRVIFWCEILCGGSNKTYRRNHKVSANTNQYDVVTIITSEISPHLLCFEFRYSQRQAKRCAIKSIPHKASLNIFVFDCPLSYDNRNYTNSNTLKASAITIHYFFFLYLESNFN